VELRRLARDLRLAIKQHVRMAKSSLSVKGAAINELDPDAAARAVFYQMHLRPAAVDSSVVS